MFKVVPDQLRISEGWVRCGHCAEVFDASANLQPDAASPAAMAPPPVVVPPPAFAAATTAPMPLPEPEPWPAADAGGPPSGGQGTPSTFSDSQLDRNLYSLLAEEPGRDSVPPPESVPPAFQPSAPPVPSRPAALERFQDSRNGAESSSLTDSTLESVTFVRDARRKAFWRKPGVRAVLSLAVLLLLGVLGLQVAVQERNRIAAMEPRARPWLEQLCMHLECAVEPLRQIESIVIDSSSFTKLRADTYRLSVTLKNNAPLALAMPAIELALTDSADQPVLRRVLLPADLGAAAPNLSPVLAPGGEWSGTFPLGVNGNSARIVGYRLLAFYP